MVNALELEMDPWDSEDGLALDDFDSLIPLPDPTILALENNQSCVEADPSVVRPWQLDKKYSRLHESPGDGDQSTPSSASSSSSASESPASPTSDRGDQLTFVWSISDGSQPLNRRRGNVARKVPAVEPLSAATRRKRKAPPHPQPRNDHHNQIEKRYRNRLSDHFQALQSAIPTLRNPDTPTSAADYVLACNPLTKGLKSTHKRNKATICAKAVEYIQHLEAKIKTGG